MPARARPTSPHWTVYRWQIGNTLSIIHRITGTFLALGLLLLTYWWAALANGPAAFSKVSAVMGSPLGLLVLLGLSASFWYHFLNGIRHLFWDAGHGFERTARHGSGWFAVIGALVLTLGLWLLMWRHLS
jgi:succinate dehydrogenase / fumarate reductase, cytochrome b subunit